MKRQLIFSAVVLIRHHGLIVQSNILTTNDLNKMSGPGFLG